MNQFRLLSKDICKTTQDSRYSFGFVDYSNFENYTTQLINVIEFISKDLVWDNAPSFSDVVERLKFGSICMLWMYEESTVGWSWVNNNCITFDWKTSNKELKTNEQYGGGAFLFSEIKQHPDDGFKFYRYGIENMFKTFNKDTLYLYSDTWNRASTLLCYKIGFTKYTFYNV